MITHCGSWGQIPSLGGRGTVCLLRQEQRGPGPRRRPRTASQAGGRGLHGLRSRDLTGLGEECGPAVPRSPRLRGQSLDQGHGHAPPELGPSWRRQSPCDSSPAAATAACQSPEEERGGARQGDHPPACSLPILAFAPGPSGLSPLPASRHSLCTLLFLSLFFLSKYSQSPVHFPLSPAVRFHCQAGQSRGGGDHWSRKCSSRPPVLAPGGPS